MEFDVSQVTLNPWMLMFLGLVIGVLGGFFGVGGSFIAGPAMFAMGMPMNYVVGTDLAHIAGKSMVAARKHRALGNIDLKLGLLMTVGTILGVELGAQIVELLQRLGRADLVIALVTLVILVTVSAWMAYESWHSLKGNNDHPMARRAAVWLHQHCPGPRIHLPTSGLQNVPLVLIIALGVIGGFFAGFLGGGAGYLRMPMMVYLLGLPTHLAVGTDLFEVVISAGYGTITHALKGNVDIMVALVMHTGAAVGANLGAGLTQLISGARLRLLFVPLPLIGAALLLYKLLGGGGH